MRHFITVALLACSAAASAAPDYRALKMEIDINKPAAEVWAKVGGYCDIGKWLGLDCKIESGDGGMGTVRSLANGRVLEILVGKTDLSYGYTQPVKEGSFYNLYHGFMEAVPVGKHKSKLVYTLLLDESDKADDAAKQADLAQRRTRFDCLEEDEGARGAIGRRPRRPTVWRVLWAARTRPPGAARFCHRASGSS